MGDEGNSPLHWPLDWKFLPKKTALSDLRNFKGYEVTLPQFEGNPTPVISRRSDAAALLFILQIFKVVQKSGFLWCRGIKHDKDTKRYQSANDIKTCRSKFMQKKELHSMIWLMAFEWFNCIWANSWAKNFPKSYNYCWEHGICPPKLVEASIILMLKEMSLLIVFHNETVTVKTKNRNQKSIVATWSGCWHRIIALLWKKK